MYQSVEQELFMDGVRRLAAGKMTSTMLELVMDLDLFGKLHGRRATVGELAALLGMPAVSARMLAQFLCREGLLTYAGGRLANAPFIETTLAVDSPEQGELRWVLNFAVPLAALRQRLFHPPVLHWYQLRDGGEITDSSSLIGQQADGWFSNFMTSKHNFRIRSGDDLAARYDFSRHRKLLDVGGATGGWCIGIRKTNPHLRCVVFDLPQVREIAEASLAEAGMDGQISFTPGSFFSDRLPRGADVALLANVVHNWEPDDGRRLLKTVFGALEPGGTLLVKEFFLEDDWTGRMEGVFDAFVMLGSDGRSGWQPTYAEMERMVREAGFQRVRRQQDLVIGRKPGASARRSARPEQPPSAAGRARSRAARSGARSAGERRRG
jgi:SAM-dependent methyltransferase